MPNLNSYADLTRDWRKLLDAFKDNAETLAPAEPQKTALEQTLVQTQELKATQDSHAASRQQSTQELLELFKVGREQARQLRGMVKGLLGTKNERLVQFEVAPLRSRSRSKATPVKQPVEPPQPE
jgi:hypothetical protein